MSAKEDLEKACSLIWQQSDLDKYVYDPCVAIELPSLGIKRGCSLDEDWSGHLMRGLLSCHQPSFEEFAFKTPLRCLILTDALEQFLTKEEDELFSVLQPRRVEFLRDLTTYVRRHIASRAIDQIVAISRTDRTDTVPRSSLRLLMHLVPESFIQEHFCGVTAVDLSGELFCGRILPKLSAFRNMFELKLSFSDVQEQDLFALTGLTDLRVLDLSGTRIGNFGLEILASCPNLRVLRLTNCLMDDGAADLLKRMKDQLECVTMSRHSVSESTVQELEEALSKIVWLGKADSTLQLN